MSFISFDEFKQMYKLSDIIYDRRGNKIYNENDYVVKSTNDFFAYLTELNFYQYLNHPCIMKIEYYCYDSDTFYFSMKKGESIIDAYNEGKITIEEITSDLLSAIIFIHNNGIGHFDIKESNIVYLDGKAMLIDFELSRKCDLYNTEITKIITKDYYCVPHQSYTFGWRDPELSYNYHNTIRADYYALAMTLYDIYFGYGTWKTRVDVYYPNIKNIKNKLLKDFIIKCTKLWKFRKEIISHPIVVRKYDGIINKRKFSDIYLCYSPLAFKFYFLTIKWMIDVMISNEFEIRTVFSSFHMFHFMLYEILGNFTDERKKLKIQLVSVCCLLLSQTFNKRMFSFKEARELCAGAYSEIEIKEMCFIILNQLNGIFLFDTYFDVAENIDQLIYLFTETLKCEYNTDIMPDFSHIKTTNSNANKYMDFNTFYDKWINIFNINFNMRNIYITNKLLIEDISNPIPFNIKPLSLPHITFDEYVKNVENIINNNDLNEYGVIIQNNNYYNYLSEENRKKLDDAMGKTERRKQLIRFIKSK